MSTTKKAVSIGTTVYYAALEDFESDNSNIRLIPGDIESLAIQLFTEGQLEPLTCIKPEEGAKLSVWNGSRRIRAFHLATKFTIVEIAGIKQIMLDNRHLRDVTDAPHPNFNPKRILYRMFDGNPSPVDLISLQLSVGGGVPFSKLERLSAIKEILRCGNVQEDGFAAFSKKFGVSPVELRMASKLFSLHGSVRKAIASARVSALLGIKIVKFIPQNHQEAFLEKAVAEAKKRMDGMRQLDRKWDDATSKIHPKDCPWREFRNHKKGRVVKYKAEFRFKKSIARDVAKFIAEIDQQLEVRAKASGVALSDSVAMRVKGIHLFGEYMKSTVADDTFWDQLLADK